MKAKQYTMETFNKAVEDVITDLYSARPVAIRRRFGRFHVAVKILLSEYGVDDQDICDSVIRDNQDKGIDYFFVSESDSILYTIQVKDHESLSPQPQQDAVAKLVDAVRVQLERKRKVASMSDLECERFDQLKELESKPEQIKYILLLTGGAKPRITIDNFPKDKFNKNESLDIFDISYLLNKAQADLVPPPQDVVIKANEEQVIEVNYGKSPKTLITYVKAVDYVSATKERGTNIFRINPRLYLGNKSKYNAGMLATLCDAEGCEQFHLLNNGITAVCKSYTHESGVIKIKDFQVVNGCQTTETLWKFHGDNPENKGNVHVLLKIIETGDSDVFARRISETTNSQTAINSIDLVANDPCHQLIKQGLNQGEKKFFYISRRGEWEQVSAAQREPYKVSNDEWGSVFKGGAFRKIQLRELAQALVSVCLNPTSAKEQITALFNSRGDNSNYSKLFEKDKAWSEPIQLLLLSYLYAYICTPAAWLDLTLVENEDQKIYNELARLGRFYIVYLIYKQWRDKYKEPFDPQADPVLLTPKNSEKILSNFLEEIGMLPHLATSSLVDVKNDNEKKIDTRHLLRNLEHKKAVEKEFKK